MLRPRAQPVTRVPPAHPQLLSLVIGHKPVVRLLLLRSADVARYCLPDHRISPYPHSPPAAGPIPVFPLIPMRQTISKSHEPSTSHEPSNCRKPGRRTPWSTLGGVYLYFIAYPTKSVRCDQKKSRSEAIADSRKRNCSEMEPVAGFDRKYRRYGGMNPDERLHRMREWSVRRDVGVSTPRHAPRRPRVYT
jgi:hypothetical protein